MAVELLALLYTFYEGRKIERNYSVLLLLVTHATSTAEAFVLNSV